MSELRCTITANLCGTDTWAAGQPCKCPSCTIYVLRAKLAEAERRVECLKLVLDAQMESTRAANRKFDEERRIVDRIWAVLGITTLEDAGGKAIHELIAEWKQRAEAAAAMSDTEES